MCCTSSFGQFFFSYVESIGVQLGIPGFSAHKIAISIVLFSEVIRLDAAETQPLYGIKLAWGWFLV